MPTFFPRHIEKRSIDDILKIVG